MRLALLGFGLIGGSVALALHERQPGRWPLVAWSPTGEGPRRAADEGVIEAVAGSPEEAVRGADIVIVAAPPLASLALLDRLAAAPLGDGAVVTDVVSTKRRMAARAAALHLPFVGGHPMAGRDLTGYGAAQGDLFEGRPWVVVAEAGDERAARVETLATATGARPMRMSAEDHDEAVAAISHLPLVLAAALVESVAGPDGGLDGWDRARALAASGWRDTTRLARGDAEMGAGIAVTNADLLSARLRRFRDVIDAWLAALDGDDPDGTDLRARLAAARRALEADRQ